MSHGYGDNRSMMKWIKDQINNKIIHMIVL
jgi:hypothetical protein